MIKRLFHLPEDSPSKVMMDTPNSGQIDFVEFSLERWREGFLRAVLYITAGIGLIAILLYVFTSSTPLFIYAAIGFYLVLLAFTFLPMPYFFRAGFFLMLLNLISLSTLLDTGVFGSAMIFFLSATVIATLIFSPRIGTIYIVAHMLLLSLVGWATISGQFTLFSGTSFTGTVFDWIQNTMYYLLLAIMIVSGIHLLKRDFFLAQTQANAVFNSLKVEQANLEGRVAARTKDLSTVAEVGTATATILETDKLLQAVVDLSKERFELYHSHIYLLDEAGEKLVLAAGAGEAGRQMMAEKFSIPLDREQSLVARAARERKGVTINDVTQAPDFLPNPLLPDTRSELAVPMIVGGKVIGVFDVQSDQVGHFTESDINIQTTLATQVATSIQNVRVFEQAKAQADLESIVNAIGQKIQRATTVDGTLQTAIRELGMALGASRVSSSVARPQASDDLAHSN